MRLAYQTIIFGPVFQAAKDLDHALEVIADAGFEGVELMQRPDRLGFNTEQPSYREHLAPLLEKHKLTLVGLAGGRVQDRADFLGDFFRKSANPPYLYVEDWHKDDEDWAEMAGVPLALHAHYFKRVHSLEEAGPLLQEHRQLKWIPDTAHLYIVGDDVLGAIGDYYDRLAAVHLKNWTPIFGRVSHRYSRGFTDLDRGDAPVKEALELLLKKKYAGWLVVEQDTCSGRPEESIWDSAHWLKMHRVTITPRRLHPAEPARSDAKVIGGEERLRFLERLGESTTRATAGFYTELAHAVADLYKAKLVAVWAYSDWNQILTLIGYWPLNEREPEPKERSTAGSLHEIPLVRMGPELFCLDENNDEYFKKRHPDRRYPYLERALALGARWVLSIPIFNSFNPNHVRFLVNVLCDSEDRFEQQDATLVASDIARAADSYSNELYIEAGARASILSGKMRRLDDFIHGLCHMVRELLQCEGCTIFLQNLSGTQLECRASTPELKWRDDLQLHERNYRPGDGSITMRIFRRREPRIYRDVSKLKGEEARPEGVQAKSWEAVATPEQDSTLLAPILDRGGRCIGVLRCRNKRTPAEVVGYFTDDDLAAIDSLLQSAVPHLVILRAEEGRTIAFRQIKHELKNPLIAIRGVLDNLQSEINLKFGFPKLGRDYFGDALSWTELMLGLFGRLDLISRGQDEIHPRAASTNLRADVIAPVIRQFRIALAGKQFARGSIRHGELDIPRLRVDQLMMQQVAFNLIDNAIKYSKPDPRQFRVWVDGGREGTNFVLRFQDWGLGVEPGLEEAIFEEGVRGPDAHQSSVEGQGLGLWLVKRIIVAHEGTIRLTSNREPTEFQILLPDWLATRAPRLAERTQEGRR